MAGGRGGSAWLFSTSLGIPAFMPAKGIWAYPEVAGEIFIFYTRRQMRLIIHEIEETFVGAKLTHILPFLAEQVIFLKDFRPVLLKGRVSLVSVFQLIVGNAMNDAIFQGLDPFPSRFLCKEAPYGNNNIAFSEEIRCPFDVSLVSISADQAFFNKADTPADRSDFDEDIPFFVGSSF